MKTLLAMVLSIFSVVAFAGPDSAGGSDGGWKVQAQESSSAEARVYQVGVIAEGVVEMEALCFIDKAWKSVGVVHIDASYANQKIEFSDADGNLCFLKAQIGQEI